MGLWFGVAAIVGTIIMCVLIIGGNASMPAPSIQSSPVMPTFVVGILIGSALIVSHYWHFSW